MSRRDDLNSIFLGGKRTREATNTDAPKSTPPAKPASPSQPAQASESGTTRRRAGAVGAMATSLGEINRTREEAEALRQQLASGDRVVDLDPATIDGSAIADRLPVETDAAFEQLVESIAERGQQLPILVRPHPDRPGRYQVAYGRRRLRAAARLERSVRAIVKELSEDELVIAQGRENLDRSDLTFIEKALFARRLQDAGFDRATLTAALSTDKADLSRYLQIASTVPEDVVTRIGPAGKVGRPRWMALAEALQEDAAMARVEAVIGTEEFGALESDQRFEKVLAAAVGSSQQGGASKAVSSAQHWSTPNGRKAARIQRKAGKVEVVFDHKAVPAFGDFVAQRLDSLYQEFVEENKGGEREDE